MKEASEKPFPIIATTERRCQRSTRNVKVRHEKKSSKGIKNVTDLQPLERKMLMAMQVPVTSSVPAWQVFRPMTRSKK